MSKAGKIILLILSMIVAFMIGTWLFIGALWSGAFNFMFPNEIATYQSPDGEYSLVFEQMGDPAWPFGPADVRLTLKDHKGKIIKRVSTQVFNDGGCASEWNMKSISWNNDAVVVILRGAEMEDKEVSIATEKMYSEETDKPISTTQLGGTLADETFDITVSYANWGNLAEIYTKALNTNKMLISSVRHLPIYKFDTLAELEQFKNDVKDVLSIDQSYDEVPSFNEVTTKYDENFFTENTLMLVYVEASSGSYRYGVDSVYLAEGNFCIHVKQTNTPEIGTDDMAGWFITVAVPDNMIADCTTFDADFQY